MNTHVVSFLIVPFCIKISSEFCRWLAAVFSMRTPLFDNEFIYASATGEISADNTEDHSQETPAEEKKPHKVLVVDDDTDVLGAICDSLGIYNIPYLATQFGKEAIQLYQANQQDIFLVILDLKMPEMDGETVYKSLSEINPNVTILISTGYHESEVMSRFIGTGQVGLLPKPFNINQLIQAINKHLPN